MVETMSSRDRLLAALNNEKPDHVPMAFMIFSALSERLGHGRRADDATEYIETQIELGLDTVVDLTFLGPYAQEIGHADAPGLHLSFGAGVETREWAEARAGQRYPLLHKEYVTPSGILSVALDQTDDWPYGDAAAGDFRVPFMDDFLAPRCSKYLVEKRDDLEPLRHLLVPPSENDLDVSRATWDPGKKLARQHDLLLAGGWGVGADALAWFCGLQNAVFMALDDPAFFGELMDLIAAWNRPRIQAFLDYGVDLFIRRAWYEGTDFWSPELYRRYFAPIVREEVDMVHGAGAKYGYVLTSGSAPLHDVLVDLGIDVLIGPDPLQGKGTDLARMGAELKGKVCTWGGVNAFVTVEQGTRDAIDAEVRHAIDSLGPEGFILSPVDNIRDPSDEVWENVLALIESWKQHRG